MRRLLAPATLLVALASVGAGPTPAVAGFWEDLFGYRPPAPRYEQPVPVTVTVRPRRSAERRTPKRSKVARNGENGSERKPVRVVSINPDAVPDWHLQDPTLRRGDIVFLKTGPVIYTGPAAARHLPADFASLQQSQMLSRAARRHVQMMAGGVWIPDATATQDRRRVSGRREASASLE